MATLICLTCKSVVGTLKTHRANGVRLDLEGHEFVTIAKGNRIEGVDAGL